ncbi:uncharacterized protein TNCV_1943441 [Trichonephila clavipes]|nr:uncharacterized protein TNCV_1943441 [Trichonephila clavipes]
MPYGWQHEYGHQAHVFSCERYLSKQLSGMLFGAPAVCGVSFWSGFSEFLWTTLVDLYLFVSKGTRKGNVQIERRYVCYNTQDVTSSRVSGDGTWKTRGHTSLIGVCALIGADCGKVLDMEVMSSYCKGCDSYKGPKKNHSGSAGGMEVYGMQNFFFRSEQKHGLKYQRYIGDGDSKTFSSIGSRLRKLKALWGKKKLSDEKTIGGKGDLTDAIISKLTTFYGNAIRANSHNVNEMRQAVWTVWAHTSSTDDEPQHWFCPKGKNSWCKYDVSVHNNIVNEFSHKNTLPKAVSEVIKPVLKIYHT